MLHDRKGHEIKYGDIVRAHDHIGPVVNLMDGAPPPNVVVAHVTVRAFRSGVMGGLMVESSDGVNRMVEPELTRVANHDCEIIRTGDGRVLD